MKNLSTGLIHKLARFPRQVLLTGKPMNFRLPTHIIAQFFKTLLNDFGGSVARLGMVDQIDSTRVVVDRFNSDEFFICFL